MRKGIVGGALVAVLGTTIWVTASRATPAAGFSARRLAMAEFGELDLKNLVPRDDHWQAALKTNGESELHVNENTWVGVGDPVAPGGGSSGWHTHPGFSLVLVTQGTVTVYDGDDATCTPQSYSAGQSFVDRGDGHVHLVRNELASQAKAVSVQLVPKGATRRIDAPDPGYCGF